MKRSCPCRTAKDCAKCFCVFVFHLSSATTGVRTLVFFAQAKISKYGFRPNRILTRSPSALSHPFRGRVQNRQKKVKVGALTSLLEDLDKATAIRLQRGLDNIPGTVDGRILHHLRNPGMMTPLQIPTHNAFLWFLRWCEADFATIHGMSRSKPKEKGSRNRHDPRLDMSRGPSTRRDSDAMGPFPVLMDKKTKLP